MKKKGAALLTVVIIMTAVLMLGAVILESQVSSFKSLKYINRDMQAYYCAEAGVNDVANNLVKEMNRVIGLYPQNSSIQTSDLIHKMYTYIQPNNNIIMVTEKSLDKDKDTWYSSDIDSYNPLPDDTEVDANNKIYFTYTVHSTGKANLKDPIVHKITATIKISVTIINNSGGGSGGGNTSENIYSLMYQLINYIITNDKDGSNNEEIIDCVIQLHNRWQEVIASDIPDLFNIDNNKNININWEHFTDDFNKIYDYSMNLNGDKTGIFNFSNVHDWPEIKDNISKYVNNSNGTIVIVGSPDISK
ncbi:hypothetical protein [Clostridium sp. DJ247]|uniref:hypothetical protein n=1 Tax=Clostridium sp. DJ247 TaxID=2726188 RepID=UPI00162634A1|nr:hypothetical protein [Clostridium sp. DJ247]MBC2579949.1 hypothetical protein [Clostridium sp. DJ247]